MNTWLLVAALDEQTLVPRAILRGKENPSVHQKEFKIWCKSLEKDATSETERAPQRTYQARKKAAYVRRLVAAGIKPEFINGDSTKVFHAWLVQKKRYKSISYTEVAVEG